MSSPPPPSRRRTYASYMSYIKVPNIPWLFNARLRFSIIRIVLYAAIVAMVQVLVAQGKSAPVSMLLITPVIVVHHIAIAFGPGVRIYGWMDLLLVFAEIAGLTYSLTKIKVDRWSAQSLVFSLTLWCILLLALSLSAFLKITETFTKRGNNLWVVLDVTVGCRDHNNAAASEHDGTESGGTMEQDGEDEHYLYQEVVRPMFINVLIGRAIWRTHFIGETRWIVFFRGAIAALFVAAIMLYAIFSIILEPIRENGLPPAREVRATDLPWDFKGSSPTVWNVLLTRMVPPQTSSEISFHDAVQVLPLWNADKRSTIGFPACAYVPEAYNRYNIYSGEQLETITFHCSVQSSIPDEDQYNIFPARYEDSNPDLLVIVNFTMLGMPTDTMFDIPRHSVQVMLGLTNSSKDVVDRTVPTTLPPGVNLIGSVSTLIRQRFKKYSTSVFGLFDAMETFVVAQIVHVYADPMAQRTPFIPQGPGISTIRLFSQDVVDFSEWLIRQEYRDKSILRGFASVGGLWTFFGGLFVIMFGSPILRILFGIKPFSVFGLMHSFERSKIREATLAEYPRLLKDIRRLHPDRGLLTLICDHLIDLGFLGKDVHDHARDRPLGHDNQVHGHRNSDTFLLQDMQELSDSPIDNMQHMPRHPS